MWLGRGNFQSRLHFFPALIRELFRCPSIPPPPFHCDVSESDRSDRSGIDLFIEPQQGTISFKKREILIVAQESFGKFEAVHSQSNLRHAMRHYVTYPLSAHLCSSYEVPPAFSWNSTHAPKFMAKVNVEVLLDHMVNPSHNFFTHRIPHHGEFAIAYKRRKGGRWGRVCSRGVTRTDPQTKMWLSQQSLGKSRH